MKTNLDLLIEHFENAKRAVEQEMEIYVQERAYLEASYFTETWYKLNQKLNRLYQLKNPLFAKIREQERKIVWIQKARDRKLSSNIEKFREVLQNRFSQDLAKAQQELVELKERTVEAGLDNSLLYILLNQLRRKELAFIKVVVQQASFFGVNMTMNGRDLVLTIEYDKKRTRFFSYESSRRLTLKKLGFDLSNGQLQMVIPNFVEAKTLSVIEKLSAIIYDTFQYDELKEEIQVIIKEINRYSSNH
ncbi:MAG: hypothetical protein AAF960_20235 [Bacteroidota bacterium]